MRPQSSPGPRAPRWLWPREHGAYAEVLFPLATALCSGHAALASVALSFAIVTAFLAHEPVLVLLGARGGGARRNAGARARAQATLLGSTSTAAALVGFAYSDWPARWALGALLPAVALAVFLALRQREKSLFGEAFVGLLFAFAAVPVALSAGWPLSAALQAASLWSCVFLLGTASVHALLARKKRGAVAPSRALVAVCAVLTAAAGLWALTGRGWWPACIIPMSSVCLAALLIGLPPKRLKLLGWAMVVAQLTTALGLCWSLGTEHAARSHAGPSVPRRAAASE